MVRAGRVFVIDMVGSVAVVALLTFTMDCSARPTAFQSGHFADSRRRFLGRQPGSWFTDKLLPDGAIRAGVIMMIRMSALRMMRVSLLPRALAIAAVLAIGFVFSSVNAQTPGQPAGARAELLDKLHAALADSSSPREAQLYSQQIWALWLSHPDPAINQLMQDALAARQGQRFELAISLLDQIIERQPDYAEAWNQRATIYFMIGNYEKSLEDVAETLKREPRHFGALSGRGMIRLRQGRDALAWQNFEAARKIHPYIAGRESVPKSAREIDT